MDTKQNGWCKMSHMTDALYLTPLRSLSENLSTFQNSQFFNILGYDSSPPMTALNSDLRYNLQNNNMANSICIQQSTDNS